MSEDLTKRLSGNENDEIVAAVKNLESYVRSALDNLVTWVSGIDAQLKSLDKKVEERLHDTRPIWHKVVADVVRLQTGQEGLRADVSKIRNTLEDIRSGQGICNDAIQKINRELHTVDDRLRRLEVN